MPGKRTTVNKDKLYTLVKEGNSAHDIMRALNIKLKQSLKTALFDLSMEKKELLVVPGMDARTVGNRKITKMGINIPVAQLKDYFKIGDKFDMEITSKKISLTKIVEG